MFLNQANFSDSLLGFEGDIQGLKLQLRLEEWVDCSKYFIYMLHLLICGQSVLFTVKLLNSWISVFFILKLKFEHKLVSTYC